MDILVLDTNFTAISILDTYESFIWTDRYDSYGDFELCLPMSKEILDIIKVDYYLWIKESEHCMIVESITVDTDTEDGDTITFAGRSLESILNRRIVWGQKILSGSVQDAIKGLINECFISPENADRKIDNFVFTESTDTRITSLQIDSQETGTNLYDLIQTLCSNNNLGFKIVLNDSNQFVFSLYAGTDRSFEQSTNPYVVFSSKYDNIVSSNYYSSKMEYKNVSLVGGEGEGSERKMASAGEATGLNRREIFIDAYDISSTTDSGTLTEDEYTAKLKSRGEEELSDYAENNAFEGEADTARMFKYGEDFFIGDIVQFEDNYGHDGAAYISEIVISSDQNGDTTYPTFKVYENTTKESNA